MEDERLKQTESVLAELRSHIVRTQAVPGGYALLFAGHSSPVLALVELLFLELLSCPSIKIEMGDVAGNGSDSVWVRFTGDECVKEFLKDELVGR